MNPLNDVIAAIATPIGEGGISVVRVSGNNAIEVADKGFRGRQQLKSAGAYTAHFGQFVDANGNVLDEVIATVFHEPHSYTAENSVEISCHGGVFVTRKILDSLIAFGARMAEPGEFTKRAFLNGRIDLSQAEAVADLIRSQSEASHKTSLQQLEGKLSIKIGEIRKRLLDLCSLIELELDFVEEGLEFTKRDQLAKEIESAIQHLSQLVNSYEYGKVCREGIKVVLAGISNVGKSSILNNLLDENRAIVTEIPGTTRDVIEENVIIDGLLFRIVDTAGLRMSHDLVEKEGMKRTESQLRSSDIIVLVVDASTGFDSMDKAILDQVVKEVSHQNLLVAYNKIDLKSGSERISTLSELGQLKSTRISALTGEGLDEFRRLLVQTALSGTSRSPGASLVITNDRHRDSLARSVTSLSLALDSLKSGRSNEFIAVDLHAALSSLGEIIGLVTSDDILNNIFSRFCIGK